MYFAHMPTDSKGPQSTRRDELIEIGARLFYEQGYASTGIKQIIDEAGIAKGTFYTHFKSKEELGVAWLKARHTQWSSWFEAELKKCKSAAEKIQAAFGYLKQWLVESGFRGCAFLNTMAETPSIENPMRSEVANHKRQLCERFCQLVGEHLEEGVGDSGNEAQQKGRSIFLLFEGALVESQNFHETWPVDVARNEVERILAV